MLVKSLTLSDDTAHPIINTDTPFYACDFQCLTNAIKIGVGGNMDFVIQANDTYWTYNANLRDFMVMNNVAGANGKVVIIATIPNQYVAKALGEGFKRF